MRRTAAADHDDLPRGHRATRVTASGDRLGRRLLSDGAALYPLRMKHVQISIDDDLDRELDRLAAALGASKAEVIRRLVRERIHSLPPLSADPIARMVGADDFEPAPVDDIVYR
jgi:hypothetical protein